MTTHTGQTCDKLETQPDKLNLKVSEAGCEIKNKQGDVNRCEWKSAPAKNKPAQMKCVCIQSDGKKCPYV